MHAVIDLGSELLVDASAIRDPYVRLLTAAVGQELAPGSPWVAVHKRTARVCLLASRRFARADAGRARPDRVCGTSADESAPKRSTRYCASRAAPETSAPRPADGVKRKRMSSIYKGA